MMGLDSDYVPPPWSDDESAAIPTWERTWLPVDLSDVLAGSWQPPRPTVGRRIDGVALFYPAKVHTVAAETEAGKTWFALSAVTDELNAGNHVLYLDFEDDQGGVVGRLLALQVDRDVIAERFQYVRPAGPLGTGLNLDDLIGIVSTTSPTIIVLDGVTEAMVLHGLDPLSNKDTAEFGRILPRRLAAMGPAFLALDHVTKDREGRGRYAIGAVHKLNGLDGAAYLLENRTPFGIGTTGRSTIKVAKDRNGQLRRNGLPSSNGLYWFGDLVLESHGEDFAEVRVEAPTERAEDFRPTHLMGRIVEALEQHGPLAQRRILAAAKGKRESLIGALDCLILDGYVSEATPHQLLKPYPPEGSEIE